MPVTHHSLAGQRATASKPGHFEDKEVSQVPCVDRFCDVLYHGLCEAYPPNFKLCPYTWVYFYMHFICVLNAAWSS